MISVITDQIFPSPLGNVLVRHEWLAEPNWIGSRLGTGVIGQEGQRIHNVCTDLIRPRNTKQPSTHCENCSD